MDEDIVSSGIKPDEWLLYEAEATVDIPVVGKQPTPENPYAGGFVLTGEPVANHRVHFKRVLSTRDNVILTLLSVFSIGAGGIFIAWLTIASRYPAESQHPLAFFGMIALIVAMILIEGIRISQSVILGVFAAFAKDPVPMPVSTDLRVAILTTIVPGKEPLPLVMETLKAMKNIGYDGTCDVWLLDEGDSHEVKEACIEAGVFHFSRKGVTQYNQPSGQFRTKTKHGNHNSWRNMYEEDYDIVAQMDPDHVPVIEPGRDIISRCAGYFTDPDVAFVVAPQVYGNLNESWIAHGAAVLCYVFHGVIQRGANALNAPLLIGTNHVYRVSAWKQVGGYQDAIIEDHITAMAIYAAKNPETGQRWKGVYTPDIVSVGEGPTSFTDIFNQQKRWAYGIWEVIRDHSPRLIPKMGFKQASSFLMLQQFYPSVAVSWVLSNSITAVYLVTGASGHLPTVKWAILWMVSVISSLALFLWLRRFNLVEHERRSLGLVGMTLMFMCIPTYVSAAWTAILGKKLTYVVTAKGSLTSRDSWRTFRAAFPWVVFALGLLVVSSAGLVSSYPSLRLWLLETLAVCLSAPVTWLAQSYRSRKNNSSK